MKIIAFCGIDGSGKSSQINIVKEELKKKGFKVLVLKVEYYPFHDYANDIITSDVICLGIALEYVKYYMETNFKEYDYVLCDRHRLCYQASALTFGAQNMEQLEYLYRLPQKEPDLAFYFDISSDTALKRIDHRAKREFKEKSKFETREIFIPTINNYKMLINQKIYSNCVIIDAEQEQAEVTRMIMKKILEI